MYRALVAWMGIITALVGLMIYSVNIQASGPEAYEEMYWAFGGCMTALLGFALITSTIFFKGKNIVVSVSNDDSDMQLPKPIVLDSEE